MDLRKLRNKKGFTLIELMVVIVIIGILVAIALPNFISAQDRAKLSSVKANMHTVQTAVETYAVDWGGVYSKHLNNGSGLGVQVEATNKNYWKEFKNPFSGQQGMGNSWIGTGMTTAVTVSPSGVCTASNITVGGAVAYEGIDTDSSANENITKYFVYGGEKQNQTCIVDKGKAFTLTNE